MRPAPRILRILLLLASCGCAGNQEGAARAAGIPEDVALFRERRDLCDHFRGEEPYDEERRAFLEANLARYCTGTDAELAALKSRYRDDEAVMELLSGYEENIEGAR